MLNSEVFYYVLPTELPVLPLELRHELAQFLRAFNAHSIVNRSTHAAHRTMALQTDHNVSSLFYQFSR